MIPRYIAAKLLKQKEENERSEDVVMSGTIMDGGARSSRTVAEVFSDFKGRRAGLITALTNEFELFFSKCDPENVNLCLYGHPNGQWDVDLPVEELPPELPEPVLGINFARDGMQKNDWACLVAVHCHTWLLSVAFYYGARYGFDKSDRKRLFKMINDLPTIPEIVMEVAKNKVKDEPSGNQNSNNNESLFNSNAGNLAKQMMSLPLKDDDDEDEDKEEDEEEEEEHGKTLCKACGEKYSKSEFWISCDMCEISFHGNRVKIFPARAVHIKQYKCSNCGIQVKQMKSLPIKDDNGEEQEQEQEKHGEILCRACGEKYSKSEFWISRDMCEVSFHGNRVKISPARAVHIKQYKCPNCNNKGSRP